MKKVTIRRYRFSSGILNHSEKVKAALQKEPETQVEVIDGVENELTVLVEGQIVAENQGERLPEPEEVLTAVRHASPIQASPDKW